MLIIDEAQHLSAEVLEEIRILSNLETDERKLLQIVLVGQLNLLDVLRQAELQQLDQRISIRCLLKPLNREETDAYITHRAARPVTLTPGAIGLVQAISGGVPRVINLLCDRALMGAAEAQTSKITDALILNGASALGLSVPESVQRRDSMRHAVRRAAVIAVSMISGLVLVIAAYLVLAFGNPFTMSRSGALPEMRPAARPATWPPLTAPPPSDVTPAGGPAPIGTSGFSVLVASFDAPRDAERADAVVRSQQLPVYVIDVPGGDGAIRRRLFVGRFSSRNEATAAREKVAPFVSEGACHFGGAGAFAGMTRAAW